MDFLSQLEDLEGNLSDLRKSNHLATMFEEFLAKKELEKVRPEKPFEHLFADIISPEAILHEFESQFQSYPSNYDIYNGLQDDANSCILIHRQMRKVPEQLFPNWVDNFLKVADHLILYYIQVYMNDTCTKLPKHGTETSRYIHVQAYDCQNIRTAGQKLKFIYENRNNNTHRTEFINGREVLVRFNYNKFRYKCLKNVSLVFSRLQLSYSNAYPNFLIAPSFR